MFNVPIANGSTTTYQAVMRHAIQTKYSMIRYYYTQLSLMSMGEVGPFYKPLYFEFPNDKNAYLETERNIMIGDAIKLSVVSNALGTSEAEFIFPNGTWCDLLKDNMADKSCIVHNGAEALKMNLSAGVDDFHVHLRAGHIIPWQNAKALNAMTTADLQKHATDFAIVPSEVGDSGIVFAAEGKFLNDDGVSTDLTKKQNIYELTFNSLQSTKTATLEFKRTTMADPPMINQNDLLGQIDILGASKVSLLKDNAINVTVQWTNQTEWVLGTVHYNSTSERLVVPKQAVDVNIFDITKLTFKPTTA